MNDLYDFLDFLGRQLNQTNEKIVVVRNYEGLPYSNPSRDIDILICDAKVLMWVKELSFVSQELGMDFQVAEQHIDHIHMEISPVDGRDLVLDLIPAFVWYGVEWLNVDNVFSDAQLYSSMIWIPCEAHECVITFCHSFLYGGHVKKKYFTHLAFLANKQPGKTSECLDHIFGKRIGKIIMQSMLSQQWDFIIRFNKLIRIYVLLREFTGHPLVFTKTLVRFFTYAPLPGVKAKFSNVLRCH